MVEREKATREKVHVLQDFVDDVVTKNWRTGVGVSAVQISFVEVIESENFGAVAVNAPSFSLFH